MLGVISDFEAIMSANANDVLVVDGRYVKLDWRWLFLLKLSPYKRGGFQCN